MEYVRGLREHVSLGKREGKGMGSDHQGLFLGLWNQEATSHCWDGGSGRFLYRSVGYDLELDRDLPRADARLKGFGGARGGGGGRRIG